MRSMIGHGAAQRHPAAAYVYSEDRRVARPAEHLAASMACCRSTAITASSGWPEIALTMSVRLAFCWAHMRRGFYDFHVSTKSPLAAEVLARIRDALCDRGRDPRSSGRASTSGAAGAKSADRGGSACLVAGSSARVSGASDLAKAMRYAMRHWPGLIVFLDDGRVEMDTNVGRAGDQAAYPDAQESRCSLAPMAGRVIGRSR